MKSLASGCLLQICSERQLRALKERIILMFSSFRKFIIYLWDFVFDHEVSPLRHIPDVAVRHYILQILGFMWAISFSLAIGSYTVMAVSIIGHTVLIAAAAITVTTLTVATRKPEIFLPKSNHQDGENS